MNRLEELKEQQKGFVSFAAKQAYINGLEIELQKAEAALAQAEKRIKELEKPLEQAYKEGWDDALDCIVADPASPYPNKAQQNNGWLESDACLALQGEEG